MRDRTFSAQVVATKIVSAVTERGSYPFPFRTRKSSPSSPMVPGPRARESRSPLDSRGPLPNRRGASSFYRTVRAIVTMQLRLALTLAATACQYRPLAAHAPLMVNRRGGFFVLYASARMNFISTLAFTTGQYRSLMAHGPLPSDGERGPSFYLYRFCKSIVPLRPCSVGLAAHEKAPTRGNLAGGFFDLSALISVKNDYSEYFAHLRRRFS